MLTTLKWFPSQNFLRAFNPFLGNATYCYYNLQGIVCILGNNFTQL